MKRKRIYDLMFFLAIIFSSATVQAEDTLKVKSVVKLSVLPVLSGYSDQLNYMSYRTQFSLTYERNIKKKYTPFIQATLVGPVNIWTYPGSSASIQNTLGFGFTTGYKKYALPELHGFYYGLAVQYFRYKTSDPSFDNSLKTITNEWEIKLIGGKQNFSRKKLVIDIYTGMGFLVRRNKAYIDNPEGDSSIRYYFGFRPYLGINIGLASLYKKS